MIISPYLLVYAFLLIAALVCQIRKKESRMLFALSFLLLTLMLTLRYGQGTDYFSYRYHYTRTPAALDIAYLFSNNGISEPLYLLVSECFRICRAPFWLFIAVISLAEMALLYRFLRLYCAQSRQLALLLLYPTIYMTYCFSALRQGFVLCLFLGVLLPLLIKKKYIAYWALALVCVGLHTASVILLMLPLALFIRLKWLKVLLPLCAAVGLALSTPLLVALLRRFCIVVLRGKGLFYLDSIGLSKIALAERTVSFAVIAFFYAEYARNKLKANEPRDVIFDTLLCLYAMGFGIYLLLCWQPLIASRMIAPMKALEIALFPFLILKLPRRRFILLGYAMALTCLMTCKNLNAYLGERFYQETAFWRYPYYSLLDKQARADRSTIPYNLRLHAFGDFIYWKGTGLGNAGRQLLQIMK